MNSRDLIKLLDRTLGNIAVRCAQLHPVRKTGGEPQRILVIRPGGIGDAVLFLPVIDALASRLPDAAIDVLAERRNHEVFYWTQSVRKVWCYDRPAGIYSILRRRYDVVIDTEQWYRLSAVVARLTGAPTIIGFTGNGRESLRSDSVPYDLAAYELDCFRTLLQPLGCEVSPIQTGWLAVSQNALSRANEVLAPLCGKPFIVLAPGASLPAKMVPPDRFQAVARSCADHGLATVIIGEKNDIAVAEEIFAGQPSLSLAGHTSLVEAAAVVALSAGIVTGDSGFLHIAAGLGVPIVAVFGPTSPEKWGPRGRLSVVVQATCSCSPCALYGTIAPCSQERSCMEAITARQVCDALGRIVER